MIIVIDAIETERPVSLGVSKMEEAFAIFRELEKRGVHELAGLAVEKISLGIHLLNEMVQAASMVSKTHDEQQQDVDMHDSKQSAPRTKIESPCSVVMGNTGAILLENTDSQASNPGRWTGLRFHKDRAFPEDPGMEVADTTPQSTAGKMSGTAHPPSSAHDMQRMRGLMQTNMAEFTTTIEESSHSDGKSTFESSQGTFMRDTPTIQQWKPCPTAYTQPQQVEPETGYTTYTDRQRGKWPEEPQPTPGPSSILPSHPFLDDAMAQTEYLGHETPKQIRSGNSPHVPMRIKRPIAKRRKTNRESSSARVGPPALSPGDEAVDMDFPYDP